MPGARPPRHQDERIFEAAQFAFTFDAALGAGMLATYGDDRGALVIEQALSKVERSPSSEWDRAVLKDTQLAHRQLGGVLPPGLRARIDGWLVEWEPRSDVEAN